MTVRRGEIYWVEFDPAKGNEMRGLRPALVIQNDLGNRYSNTTIVAAITRTVPEKAYPFMVYVDPQDSGLPFPGSINCAQIMTVQQTGPDSRLRPAKAQNEVLPIGKLSDAKMTEVNGALAYNLALQADSSGLK